MDVVDFLTNFAHAGDRVRNSDILRNDGRTGVIRTSVLATLLLIAVSPALPASTLDVKIGYIGTIEKTTTISLLDMPASNAGLAGAQLAVDDNNTTGKFLNQSFALQEIMLNGDHAAA